MYTVKTNTKLDNGYSYATMVTDAWYFTFYVTSCKAVYIALLPDPDNVSGDMYEAAIGINNNQQSSFKRTGTNQGSTQSTPGKATKV